MLFLSTSLASWASLAAGLAAACVAGSALAAVEDTFPREPTRAAILRWLAGNSNLDPEAVVTMTDELVVAITAREDGRGVGRSTRLSLREEIINPDAAAAWGGRSIQLDLDLDCTRRRVILGARRIYSRPNLQGSVRITRSDNAWAEVPPDTVIEDVARVACSPKPTHLAEAPPAAAAEAPAAATPPAAAPSPAPPETPPTAAPPVQLATAEPPSATGAPPLDTATAPPPAPTPEAPAPAVARAPAPVQVVAADPAPPPSPPAADTAAAAPEPGRSVQFGAAEPPPAPAAQPAETTVTMATPSGAGIVVVPAGSAPELQGSAADQSVMVHNPFAAEEPAQQAVAAGAPAAPPRQADVAVQIAAVASADLARDSWQALRAKLPELIGPRTFAVEPVTANGRTLYRALLLGFSTPNEAAALCKTLRSQSIDCILRQMK